MRTAALRRTAHPTGTVTLRNKSTARTLYTGEPAAAAQWPAYKNYATARRRERKRVNLSDLRPFGFKLRLLAMTTSVKLGRYAE
jgi:hypothetical protein